MYFLNEKAETSEIRETKKKKEKKKKKKSNEYSPLKCSRKNFKNTIWLREIKPNHKDLG